MSVRIFTVVFLGLLTTSAFAGTQKIVVSIAPLHSIVTAIIEGSDYQADLLLATGSSPHDFQLKPSQRRQLEQADLIVWVGPNLESSLTKIMAQKQGKVFGLEQYGSALQLLHWRTLHEHDGELVDEHGNDPHFWLSPDNIIAFAHAFADQMTELDGANSDLYQRNERTFVDHLNVELADWKQQLQPYHDQPFIVLHDGYQYLDHYFGLNFVAALSINPQLAPGLKTIQSIDDLIEQQHIRCVFAEPQYSQAPIRHFIEQQKLGFYSLDTIGYRLEPGKDLIFQLMASDVAQLKACLSE